MNWWQRFRRSDQLEAELDSELRFHFEAHVDACIRNGMTEAEARRLARIEFGGLDQVKEVCRDARGTRWLEDIVQDFRFALRQLTKQRSFALVTAIVLALGIGANGMFLTLVEMICIRGLPIERPDRVMYVATREAEGRNRGISYRDFEDLRAATRTFAGMAAFIAAPMAIADEGRAPDRFPGTYISASAFGLIGKAPTLGRGFEPEDDRPGSPPVVILGNSVWQSRYGSDPSVIDRTVRVNGTPSTVIGVMAVGFRFPINADVWQPLALMPDVAMQGRDVRTLAVFGRLVDSATATEASGEVEATAARLSREYPDTNRGIQITIEPINDHYNSDLTDPTWLAFITAGTLVLLIACANVANLLMMRSTQRSREIAIRASLGATRRRVIRQLLVESTLLAVLGGVAGLGLSVAGLRAVSSFTPQNTLPYWMDFTMDGPLIGVLAAICLGTSFVFGLVPALHLSRMNPNGVLKSGGSATGADVRGRRWTAAFLTCQFAVAVLLLAHLTLGVRLSRAQRERDPEIDMPRLLTMSVALPNQRYQMPADRITFYERLDERLRRVAPIASMAIATALPFGGAAPRQLAVDGVPAEEGRPAPTVWIVIVGPRYFETIGPPLLRGRTFDDRDGTTGYQNVIINQRFAALHFPNTDPIGRRIRVTAAGTPVISPWLTIVGISPTIRQRAVPEPDPVVYLPFRAEPPATATVIVRGRSEPMPIGPLVREEVRALDPDLPLYRVITLEQAVTESQWNGRTSNFLIIVITCIPICLAAIGLYAVTSHSVAQQMKEIGIRMAIGAQPYQLGWLVISRVTPRLGVGLAFGLAGTMAWERLFASYSTNALRLFDPLNLILLTAVLILVSAAACLWPVRRAMSLDPIVVLRHE